MNKFLTNVSSEDIRDTLKFMKTINDNFVSGMLATSIVVDFKNGDETPSLNVGGSDLFSNLVHGLFGVNMALVKAISKDINIFDKHTSMASLCQDISNDGTADHHFAEGITSAMIGVYLLAMVRKNMVELRGAVAAIDLIVKSGRANVEGLDTTNTLINFNDLIFMSGAVAQLTEDMRESRLELKDVLSHVQSTFPYIDNWLTLTDASYSINSDFSKFSKKIFEENNFAEYMQIASLDSFLDKIEDEIVIPFTDNLFEEKQIAVSDDTSYIAMGLATIILTNSSQFIRRDVINIIPTLDNYNYFAGGIMVVEDAKLALEQIWGKINGGY